MRLIDLSWDRCFQAVPAYTLDGEGLSGLDKWPHKHSLETSHRFSADF